jgi:hypothetical protein
MTPKEKAEKLFNQMYMVEDPMGSYPMCFDTAKQCALILVEEILRVKNNFLQTEYQEYFWEEVYREVKNYKKTKLPQFEAVDGEVNNITFDFDENTEKEQLYQTTFTMKLSDLYLEEMRKVYDKLWNSGESIVVYLDKDGNLIKTSKDEQ